MPELKIVVAVGGASGALYAKVLFSRLEALKGQIKEAGVLFSPNARKIWEHELGAPAQAPDFFTPYDNQDYNAPFASGSAGYHAMIVCPCSMGAVGRMTAGISDSLATRTADVMLKERKKLILVTRETPLSLIHLENMTALTRAGAIICPACPSFYSNPQTMDDMAATVVDRVLDLAGFDLDTFRWQGQ